MSAITTKGMMNIISMIYCHNICCISFLIEKKVIKPPVELIKQWLVRLGYQNIISIRKI